MLGCSGGGTTFVGRARFLDFRLTNLYTALASSFVERLASTFGLRIVWVLHFDPGRRAANVSLRTDHQLADDSFHVAHADLCKQSLAVALNVIDKQNATRRRKMKSQEFFASQRLVPQVSPVQPNQVECREYDVPTTGQ
jgi:hypothetical protein